MSDNTDDKVDYLNSPDMGSVGSSAIEGFKAPIIERPAGGVVEAFAKPQPVLAPENNSAALRSVRSALAAENISVRTSQVAGIPVEIPKVPFDVNDENRENINRMMEDSLEAEESKRKVIIVKEESNLSEVLKLAGRVVSSMLQKR